MKMTRPQINIALCRKFLQQGSVYGKKDKD